MDAADPQLAHPVGMGAFSPRVAPLPADVGRSLRGGADATPPTAGRQLREALSA